MARPTDAPAWATSDIIDGTSGQNNKVKPPGAYETGGWSYQEKPARNYDNWVKWNHSEWINYLDAVATRGATYKVAASNSATDTQNHADVVCSGTDDHVEINAAITSVSATGGIVLLSEGTFSIGGPITMASSVHLVGSGSTVIGLAAGAPAGSMVSASSIDGISVSRLALDGTSGSRATDDLGISLSGCDGVQVLDVTIRDISNATTSGHGILISECDETVVSQCTLRDCEGDGVRVEDSPTSNRTRIVDCHAEGCGGYGVYNGGAFTVVRGLSAATCSGPGAGDSSAAARSVYSACTIQLCASDSGTYGLDLGLRSVANGCVVSNCFESGIRAQLPGCVISGCVSDSNNETGILLSSAAPGSSASGCTVTSNGQDGIRAAGGSVVSGCFVSDNSALSDDVYSGIAVLGDDNVVTCNLVKAGVTDRQRWGISYSASTTGSYIYGNEAASSSKSGGAGGSIGTDGGLVPVLTIPEWTGSGASANTQNTVGTANRT